MFQKKYSAANELSSKLALFQPLFDGVVEFSTKTVRRKKITEVSIVSFRRCRFDKTAHKVYLNRHNELVVSGFSAENLKNSFVTAGSAVKTAGRRLSYSTIYSFKRFNEGFDRWKFVCLLIFALLLANSVQTTQYIALRPGEEHEAEEYEMTLNQFLHRDGAPYNYFSNKNVGTSFKTERIANATSQTWTQNPPLDKDKTVKGLYSHLYIEPHAGFELKINGTNGDKAGHNITACNVNADKYDDIIVGAPFGDAAGTDRGVTYIYFGYSTLMEIQYLDYRDANVTLWGANDNDHFGWSVANASDVNDDNMMDLIVGAPDALTTGTTRPGKSYIYYGGAFVGVGGGTLTTTSDYIYGDGTNPTRRLAQSFSPKIGMTAIRISIFVEERAANPAGITLRLQTNNDAGTADPADDYPSGTDLTSLTFDPGVNDLVVEKLWGVFDIADTALSANTRYWIVAETADAAGWNWYEWRNGGAYDSYREHKCYRTDTAWTVETGKDLLFRVEPAPHVTITGGANGDKLGWTVGGYLNMNRDLYEDVVVGSPTDPSGAVTDYNVYTAGTTGQNYPFYGGTIDACRMQLIYLQSEIRVSGTIDKIYFDKAAANGAEFYNFRVYLGHTTLTEFPSTSFVTTGMSLVLGPVTLTLPAAAGYFAIDVDNTFVYNNQDNLIVEIRWNGDNGVTKQTNGATVATYRRLYASSDTATTGTTTTTEYNFKIALIPSGVTYVLFGSSGMPDYNLGVKNVALVVGDPAALDANLDTPFRNRLIRCGDSVTYVDDLNLGGTYDWSAYNLLILSETCADTIALSANDKSKPILTLDAAFADDLNLATVVGSAIEDDVTITDISHHITRIYYQGQNIVTNSATHTIEYGTTLAPGAAALAYVGTGTGNYGLIVRTTGTRYSLWGVSYGSDYTSRAWQIFDRVTNWTAGFAKADIKITGAHGGDIFGYCVAGAGDVNSTGIVYEDICSDGANGDYEYILRNDGIVYRVTSVTGNWVQYGTGTQPPASYKYVGIANDTIANPGRIYIVSDTGVVYYTTSIDGNWARYGTGTTQPPAGTYVDIASDGQTSGTVYILRSDGYVSYVTSATGSWAQYGTGTQQPPAGTYKGIAADITGGRIYIVRNDGYVSYVTSATGNWAEYGTGTDPASGIYEDVTARGTTAGIVYIVRNDGYVSYVTSASGNWAQYGTGTTPVAGTYVGIAADSTTAGKIYILSKTDGYVSYVTAADGNWAQYGTGTKVPDFFKDDLIVGAPRFKSGNDKGRAYIFYGRRNMDWKVPHKWDLTVENADVILVGENNGDKFGHSVFRAGDCNDDGYDDVVVGAPGYATKKGRAYVYFGNPTMGYGGAASSNPDWDKPYGDGGGSTVIATRLNIVDKIELDIFGHITNITIYHSPITIDGNPNDWYGVGDFTIGKKSTYEVEYIWRDETNDVEYPYPNDPRWEDGSLDLEEVRWCVDDRNLNFLFKFGSIDNTMHYPNGFSEQIIGILIDQDRGEGGGRTDTIANAGVTLTSFTAWEFAVLAHGKGCKVIDEHNATYSADAKGSVGYDCIEIAVPKMLLGLDNLALLDGWTFSILIGAYDDNDGFKTTPAKTTSDDIPDYSNAGKGGDYKNLAEWCDNENETGDKNAPKTNAYDSAQIMTITPGTVRVVYGTGASGLSNYYTADYDCWWYPIIDEDFNGGAIPAGWTVSTTFGATAPPTPAEADWHISHSQGDYYMVTDSNLAGNGDPYTTWLKTPVFGCVGWTTVRLEFDTYFKIYAGAADFNEVCRVYVAIDGSVDTGDTLALEYTEAGGDVLRWQTVDITTPAADQANVQIGFYFNADFDYWWAIDDVWVCGKKTAAETGRWDGTKFNDLDEVRNAGVIRRSVTTDPTPTLTTFAIKGGGATGNEVVTVKGPCDIGRPRPTVSRYPPGGGVTNTWSATWDSTNSWWRLTVPSANIPVGDYRVYLDDEFCTLYVIFDVFEARATDGDPNPSGMTANEFAGWAYSEATTADNYGIVQYVGAEYVAQMFPYTERVTEIVCSSMGSSTITPYDAVIKLYRIVNARISWKGIYGNPAYAMPNQLNLGTNNDGESCIGLTVSRAKQVAQQTGTTLPNNMVARFNCAEFATTTTSLIRSMGIPARVFMSGDGEATVDPNIWGWGDYDDTTQAWINNPDMSLSQYYIDNPSKRWIMIYSSDQYVSSSQNSDGESAIDDMNDMAWHGYVLDIPPSTAAGETATKRWVGTGSGSATADWETVDLGAAGDVTPTQTRLPTIDLGAVTYGYFWGDLGAGDRDFFRVKIPTGMTTIDLGLVEGAKFAQIYVRKETSADPEGIEISPRQGLKSAYLSDAWGDDKILGFDVSAIAGSATYYLSVMVDNAKSFQFANDYSKDAATTAYHAMAEVYHYKLGIHKVPPWVTVLQPNGGESLLSGGTYDIKWKADDVQTLGLTPITLYYSTDGGSTWTQIATGEANDGIYTWSVPAGLTEDDCRVKVVCTDSDSLTGEDISDADFTIKGSPANLMEIVSGASANPDWYGHNVSYAGDVNGDGRDDIIVGAPYADFGATADTGAVYIFFGRAPPNDWSGANINPASANVVIYGAVSGGHFGWSVSDAGEVNGITPADIIVGEPDNGNGYAYVIYGRADWSTVTGTQITNVAWGTTVVAINGEAAGDKFGFSVSDAGNVNNADNNDLIVGAYEYGTARGRAYVFFGDGSIPTTAGTADGIFTGQSDNDKFGYSVSNVGSVNGDAYADVIVGAPGADNNRGKAYVFFGAASLAAKTHWYNFEMASLGYQAEYIYYTNLEAGTFNTNVFMQLAYTFGTTTTYPWYYSANENYRLGYDTDDAAYFMWPFRIYEPRDIIESIYVEEEHYSEAAVASYLYIWNYATAAWEQLATSSLAGDIVLSGTISAKVFNYIDPHGFLYVHFYRVDAGAVAQVIRTDYIYVRITYRTGVCRSGENANDNFGWSVAGAGDVNGDGYADFIVGAPGYDSNKGRAYIYYGGLCLTTLVSDEVIIVQQQGDNADYWAGKDTWLDQGNPTYNYGITTTLNVKYSTTDSERTLLEFVLGDLPKNAVVAKASLKLYCSAATLATDSVTISVYRVTNPWHEGIDNGVAATGTPAGATWNNRVGTTLWTTAGGDYDPTAIAAVDVSSLKTYSWDITSLVSGWHKGTYPNYGLILIGTAGIADSYKQFYSAERTALLERFHTPRLEITLRFPADKTITGQSAGDRFGFSVHTAGNIDSAGYDDIIIGAPYRTVGANAEAGTAYVFMGDGFIPDNAACADYKFEGLGANYRAGISVCKAGSINGDPVYKDVIIGAPRYNADAGYTTVRAIFERYYTTFRYDRRNPAGCTHTAEASNGNGIRVDFYSTSTTTTTIGYAKEDADLSPNSYWVIDMSDYAANSYTYNDPEVITVNQEQWDGVTGGSALAGDITATSTITPWYYHQWRVTYSPQKDAAAPCPHPLPTASLTMDYTSLGTLYSDVAYGTYWTDCNSVSTYDTYTVVAGEERWAPTPASETITSDGTHTITYYHQFYVTIQTSGGVLSSAYSSSAYVYQFGVEINLGSVYDLPPGQTRSGWADCRRTARVLTPVQGPTQPRDIKYVCDDPSVIVTASATLTFLFHAEFAVPGDVKIDGENSGDMFGFSVCGDGRHNADTIEDLLIGAPYYGPEDKGKAYVYYGNGPYWSRKSSGTTSPLYGISMYSTTNGIVVGAGVIRYSTNGGNTWSAGAGFDATATYYGVSMASSSTAWAVGGGGRIYKTTDSGANWAAQTSGTTNDLMSVDFYDTSRGMAVGGSGTVRYTTDGGTTWSAGTGLDSSKTYYSVSVVESGGVYYAWAVGSGGVIYYSSNGGASWTQQTSPTTAALFGVSMISTVLGFAVGAGGTILKWDGTEWTAEDSGTTNDIRSVSMVSDTLAFAVGAITVEKAILKWDGMLWGAMHDPNNGAYTYYSVSVTTSTFGAAAGASGELIKFGGWGIGTTLDYRDADVVLTGELQSDLFGWSVYGDRCDFDGDGLKELMVGAPLYETDDRGRTYINTRTGYPTVIAEWYDMGTDDIIYKYNGAAPYEWTAKLSPADKPLNGVVTVNDGTTDYYGIAVGYQTIVYSADGETWTASTDTDIGIYNYNDISGIYTTSVNAWAVGEKGRILQTTDGGVNWLVQGAGVTNEELLGVSFYDASRGVAVGYQSILYTTNGGTTWRASNDPEVGSYIYYDVCVRYDSVATTYPAWTVGSKGRIMKNNNMAAADGGNWYVQSSGTTKDLLSVSFYDKDRGVAVGVNTILYTTDGGTTWTASTDPDIDDYIFYGVSMVTATDVWAVGNNKGTYKGRILYSSDGGASWTVQRDDIPDLLCDVSMISTSYGFTVGNGYIKFAEKSFVAGATRWYHHKIPVSPLNHVAQKNHRLVFKLSVTSAFGTPRMIPYINLYYDSVTYYSGYEIKTIGDARTEWVITLRNNVRTNEWCAVYSKSAALADRLLAFEAKVRSKYPPYDKAYIDKARITIRRADDWAIVGTYDHVEMTLLYGDTDWKVFRYPVPGTDIDIATWNVGLYNATVTAIDTDGVDDDPLGSITQRMIWFRVVD